MEITARFAPSPTGHVHIGNIRTAIFNWLFARHCGGKFLLRVEDTDKERSTRVAIDTLLECMDWLGLDYDGDIFHQSAHADRHREASEKMIGDGYARRLPADPAALASSSAVLFKIPWNTDGNPAVRICGDAEISISPSAPVKISAAGVQFSQLNEKGKSQERSACLGGFHELKIYGASGGCLFDLENEIQQVLGGKTFTVENAAKFAFKRREVFFRDLIKGELAKPLDSMKDFIIVRSDGNPVFHLSNVCDDLAQNITHIIRGDDHVENTYRHVFMFQALGAKPPLYGHLPMIVNKAGKPYSKRDGDAYVGDFRDKGFLADALFNYLSLLGWSPGDDREKMSRKELIEAFALERVKSSSAQFDIGKLTNMNGQYIAEMKPSEFAEASWTAAESQGWTAKVEKECFAKIAALMQSRTKLLSHAASWKYFFFDEYDRDEKAEAKFLSEPAMRAAVGNLHALLSGSAEFSLDSIQTAIREAEKNNGIPEGKLNQPLRIALTGQTTGAGIYETIEALGREKTLRRLKMQ